MTTDVKPANGKPANVNRIGLTQQEYRGGETTLCQGCGHNSITAQIIAAAYDLSLQHLESERNFLNPANPALRRLIIQQVRRLHLRGGHVEATRFGTDLFDTELILRAERAGLPTTEIPVRVEETRPSRSPIVRRVVRSLVGLARLRVVLWRD